MHPPSLTPFSLLPPSSIWCLSLWREIMCLAYSCYSLKGEANSRGGDAEGKFMVKRATFDWDLTGLVVGAVTRKWPIRIAASFRVVWLLPSVIGYSSVYTEDTQVHLAFYHSMTTERKQPLPFYFSLTCWGVPATLLVILHYTKFVNVSEGWTCGVSQRLDGFCRFETDRYCCLGAHVTRGQ